MGKKVGKTCNIENATDFIKLRCMHLTHKQIAEMMGLELAKVQSIATWTSANANKLGVTFPKIKRRDTAIRISPYDKKTAEEIVRLRLCGSSYDEIQRITNVPAKKAMHIFYNRNKACASGVTHQSPPACLARKEKRGVSFGWANLMP